VLAKQPAKDGEGSINGAKKLRTVRGGGICQKGDKPALARGSLHTMVCMATTGADPRPRWQDPQERSSRGSQGSRGSRGSHAHKTSQEARNRLSRRQR